MRRPWLFLLVASVWITGCYPEADYPEEECPPEPYDYEAEEEEPPADDPRLPATAPRWERSPPANRE